MFFFSLFLSLVLPWHNHIFFRYLIQQLYAITYLFVLLVSQFNTRHKHAPRLYRTRDKEIYPWKIQMCFTSCKLQFDLYKSPYVECHEQIIRMIMFTTMVVIAALTIGGRCYLNRFYVNLLTDWSARYFIQLYMQLI